MPQVEIDASTFKILASDTRLDILKSLDKRKMTLEELTHQMNLKKTTVHEHLTKLTDVELVKRHKRPGHKWIYYDLSWKSRCLLHPESTRIVVLIGMTVFSLLVSIISMISLVYTLFKPGEEGVLLGTADDVLVTFSFSPVTAIALICCTSFILFLAVTIWRVQKNKVPSL